MVTQNRFLRETSIHFIFKILKAYLVPAQIYKVIANGSPRNLELKVSLVFELQFNLIEWDVISIEKILLFRFNIVLESRHGIQ